MDLGVSDYIELLDSYEAGVEAAEKKGTVIDRTSFVEGAMWSVTFIVTFIVKKIRNGEWAIKSGGD
jgi:hypothetical protein